MISKKTINLIKIGSLILVFVLAVSPLFAHALLGIDIGSAMIWALGWVIRANCYAFGFIGSLFVRLGGIIIDYAIDINSQIITSPIVTTGFKISLGVANLGFVAAIIIIAIATILRIPSYEMKSALWRLILAAFLVNFSLVFAGLFLDFAGVLASFFLNAATEGSYASFAGNLAAAFGPQGLLTPGEPSSAGSGIMAVILGLVTPIFVAIFTVMLAIVLIGTGLIILIRYIYLSILIVLMPLAWVLWVLPKFRAEFSAWWDKFLNQVFFLPAACFFLYLTVVAGDILGKQASENAEKVAGAGFQANLAAAGPTFANASGVIMQMIVLICLLVGGLIAAQKLGAVGAGAVMGAAKAAGMATGKFAGKIAMKPAAWAGGAASNALLKKGGMADRFSTTLAKIPGLRGASVGLSNLVASRSGAVEAKQKEFSNLSKGALTAMAKGPLPGGAVTKAAMANELAKKGALTEENLGKDRYEDLIKASADMGATKDIVASRPDTAGIIERRIAQNEKRPAKPDAEVIAAVVKKASPEDVQKYAPETFGNIDVVLSLRPGQLKNFAVKASPAQLEALNKAAEKVRDTLTDIENKETLGVSVPPEHLTRRGGYEKFLHDYDSTPGLQA